jgi:hypothetical protein
MTAYYVQEENALGSKHEAPWTDIYAELQPTPQPRAKDHPIGFDGSRPPAESQG